MTNEHLRVALDLSGLHEPLGNGMALLADSFERQGLCDVVRFRTESSSPAAKESSLRARWLWRGLWHRSLGRKIDALLPVVDVIHVARLATPPTRFTPLLISVDDLRPLRDDAKDRQRVVQLLRAVKHGARIVATSRTASLEVQRSLSLQREQVVVVSPAVSWDRDVENGRDLVVNITGRTDEFLAFAPALIAMAQSRNSRVVVLASHEAATRLRASALDVTVRARRDAAEVLTGARMVLHLSDGARFPYFAIAALAAGVPTCATPTPVNRELLEGAASLVDDADPVTFSSVVYDVWQNDALRAVLQAAGRVRATDFSPDVAARQFLALYSDMVRRGARV